jgi:polysaccharide export outer membrane protein
MRKSSYLLIFALGALLVSCGSSKKIAYLQNSDWLDAEKTAYLYDARIMPKDQLTITVNTVNPEAAYPFNLVVQANLSGNNSISSRSYVQSQQVLQSYLVDNNGCINFPVVGNIAVGGLTKTACEKLILDKIRPFLNENERPIVTVRMANYKISVLGEVEHPGMFTVSNEKITVLEALAQAGDLTIYGVRDHVKLIREDASGHKEIHVLNLNDANLIASPYYYMQQNDVLYVEPNKVKARNTNISSSTTIWFSITSALLSLATFMLSVK